MKLKTEVLETIRYKYNNFTSAYAYNSIRIWQSAWGLEPVYKDDMYTVRIPHKGGNTWFFPCGDSNQTMQFIEEHLREDDFKLVYLSERDVGFLNEYFEGDFKVERTFGDDEYIYSIQEHLQSKGKRYSYSRGHWSRFLKQGKASIVRADYNDAEDMGAIKFILDEWSKHHDNSVEMKLSEGVIISEAEKLGIELYIIYMGDKPFSVQGGFDLGNGYFDLCLTKEAWNFSGGAYGAKRLLLEQLAPRYQYINVEEDMGLPGLRQIKRSLAPIRMNEMWSATRIKREGL